MKNWNILTDRRCTRLHQNYYHYLFYGIKSQVIFKWIVLTFFHTNIQFQYYRSDGWKPSKIEKKCCVLYFIKKYKWKIVVTIWSDLKMLLSGSVSFHISRNHYSISSLPRSYKMFSACENLSRTAEQHFSIDISFPVVLFSKTENKIPFLVLYNFLRIYDILPQEIVVNDYFRVFFSTNNYCISWWSRKYFLWPVKKYTSEHKLFEPIFV